MKLHFSKILLFFIPSNILLTSYHAPNKNKLYVTLHHTPIYTSRVLSECDIQLSIYDKNAEMKSVKEIFDRQTSQRFEEYEERMKGKRQKHKKERDKNIQKIIENDKMEKSLSEKIEKSCLKCGCGLGGVAASIGLFGGLGIYGWKNVATTAAITAAEKAAMVEGEAARIAEGIKAVIEGITKEFGVSTLKGKALESYITQNTYNNAIVINSYVKAEYDASSCIFGTGGSGAEKPICIWEWKKSAAALKVQKGGVSTNDLIKKAVENIVTDAKTVAERAVETATKEAIKASTDAVESTYASCQTAIIASVVALLVIVLIMVIIYLVLRYRRKKKMNKKAQYTKLLNQ
ncbi:rifin PIR protein, putative [Plasmodium reichenowi]|uniref:Rifin PIR protein, putative n=1 Tax=Plasmodium reichenowi TaxID=5854 RepID=A0A2P9DTB0_PLARE|nr:rifin PIR protein, putative [Plasmodium reichenowi]